METEKHFILECDAFKDLLAASSWDNLFSEGFVENMGAFILRLHRKREEYINQMKKQSVPYAIFNFVDVIFLFSFS